MKALIISLLVIGTLIISVVGILSALNPLAEAGCNRKFNDPRADVRWQGQWPFATRTCGIRLDDGRWLNYEAFVVSSDPRLGAAH